MLSMHKKIAKKIFALALVVGALSFGASSTKSQSTDRYTLCEYDSSSGITTCDSFGSSAGYFRYQCDAGGNCW